MPTHAHWETGKDPEHRVLRKDSKKKYDHSNSKDRKSQARETLEKMVSQVKNSPNSIRMLQEFVSRGPTALRGNEK